MKSLGKKIRKCREWFELSQEYMALQLGITQSTYSKIERGQIEVPHERIRQIASIFGLSTDDLLLIDFTHLPMQQGGLKVKIDEIRPQIQNMYRDKIQELESEITDLKKQMEDLNHFREKIVPS